MKNLARTLRINIFILFLSSILTPNLAFASSISDASILKSISKALEVEKSKTSQNNGIKIAINTKTIEPSEEFNIRLITPKINKKLDQEITNAHEILKKGYYEIAVQIYKNLHHKYPKDLNISFALGYSYHKLNQFEKAKRIYYKLIGSDYKYKNKVINNILDIVTGQPNGDVFYILKKLATENSNNLYILSRLAFYYQKINKLNEAIVILKRATSMKPEEISYKVNLAILYDKNSEYQNAIILYQKILDDYSSRETIDNRIPIFDIKNRLEFIKNKT